RVDVTTGGASAIYGADGVSGVVNFIVKRDLEGIHAKSQIGTSQDGGGGKYIATLAVGHNFGDDKGNITILYEGFDQDSFYFTQRDFTDVGGFTAFVPRGLAWRVLWLADTSAQRAGDQQRRSGQEGSNELPRERPADNRVGT